MNKMRKLALASTWIVLLLAICLTTGIGCSMALKKRINPYEDASSRERESFLRVRLPFASGVESKISQGAFGSSSHHEPGNEYSWGFDVPLGTPVLAVQDGKVIEVWEPKKGGGCEPRFSDWAHNVKVEHPDLTVAQYVHVDSRVRVGDQVRAGQMIAITANNGWLCTPQLHFGVYASRSELYGSSKRKNLPLAFEGLPDGMAWEGMSFKVLKSPER